MAAWALSVPSPGRAQVDVHITIGPPIPGVVFEQPPVVERIPQSDVYYAPSVQAYDTYRIDDWWYINRDGYWYRSRSHRSGFEPLPYDHIPRQLLSLPDQFHHHPAYRERRARPRAYDAGYDDVQEGIPPQRHHGSAERARAYREGAYDSSHDFPDEKHQGKHYGKHEGKHTQHD